MSKVTIRLYFNGDNFGEPTAVTFEGATVSEALAMKVEYLLNVGVEGEPAPADESASAVSATPSTPKPSGFLNKVKGGTDA